jgi:hypothetical protein
LRFLAAQVLSLHLHRDPVGRGRDEPDAHDVRDAPQQQVTGVAVIDDAVVLGPFAQRLLHEGQVSPSRVPESVPEPDRLQQRFLQLSLGHAELAG